LLAARTHKAQESLAYGRDKFTFRAEYEWWQRKRATGIGMSPNMQAFVETILSRLAETEDLTLLHPKSTWQIYEATVKEGKH
jgi:hypothetical protein